MSARREWTLVAVLALACAGVYAVLAGRDGAEAEPAALAATQAPADTPAPAPVIEAPAMPTLPVVPIDAGLPTAGQWRGHPVLSDVDEDGRLDLLASIRRHDRQTPGDGLNVWLNRPDGPWTKSVHALRRDMGYGGVAVADIDADGHLDLAFSGHDVAPHAYLGDGAGNWALSWAAYDLEGVCADVALGDPDGDGVTDLATLGFFSEGDGLVVYRGDGAGAFHRWQVLLEQPAFGASVEMVDVDGDGRPEVLAATSAGIRLWSHDAEAGWQDRSAGLEAPEVGGTDLAVVAEDLDGDGTCELIAAGMLYPGHAPLRVFRWSGAAWESWGRGLPDGEAFFDVAVGRADPASAPLLVASGKYGVQVIDVAGPGEFRSRGRIEDTEGVLNVAVGDVDGDGRDDLLCIGFRGVQFMQLPAVALKETAKAAKETNHDHRDH
jgi:hypothetical protein